MSTRAGHIAAAEAALRESKAWCGDAAARHIARAQVHATLAALYPAPYNKDADE